MSDTAQASTTPQPTESTPSPRPVAFAHPSEEDFAKILDFYQIKWDYEPRSFVLETVDGRPTEMFTPDFYLPEIDQYLELTTMRQSLVTEKNRKLRRMRERYPDIKVRLLYRRDYHRILAKYGYGPLAKSEVQQISRVLFSARRIEQRAHELGQQISLDYADRRLLLVGVLKGMICFMADLMRQITVPLTIDFMAISYYEGDGGSAVRIVKDLEQDIGGADVLLVEDIVDTGMTLNYILGYLEARRPRSLKVAALLDKRVRRLVDVSLDYVGFEVPDEFLVGYGLDYEQQFRNLPFIGVLKPEPKQENAPSDLPPLAPSASPASGPS